MRKIANKSNHVEKKHGIILISFIERAIRLPICNSLGHTVRIVACRHVARRLGLRLIHNFHYITLEGRYSSVGIYTRCGMDGPGIESGWETRSSASVQNGPAPTHPQPLVQWLPDLFPGDKAAGAWC